MPLNPSKVKDQIALLSSLNLDKIVRVFEGSYNAATDTIARSYTFAGFPLDVYFYRFAHGLPRPVECDLLASTDGGTTYIDGGFDRIAISDSTYVYVFDSVGAAGAGTVRYKVLCNWIDNYDATNPFITSVMYRSKELSLDSRVNYQKIYDQNVLTFNSSSTQTVIHTLGYEPNAKVFFEAFPGEVWPLNAGGTTNLFLVDDSQPECTLKIEDDQISLAMSNVTTTTRAWYKIYYDAN